MGAPAAFLIAEVEAHLSELVDRAEAGEAISILRDGSRVARIVPAPETQEEAVARRLKALDEIANGLVRAERRERTTAGQSDGFIDIVHGLNLRIDPPLEVDQLPAIMALARNHRLTVYDAAHVDLAACLALPLATADAAMIRDAQALGIALIGADA